MRVKLSIICLLAIFTALLLAACGGEDDSGDGDGGDEDGETIWLPSDGDDSDDGDSDNADGDEDDVIIDPGKSDYDGYWAIQDLNVPDWFTARELVGLYLAINGKYMAWWMPREEVVGCSGVDLIQMDAHKFVPEDGVDVCCYNFEFSEQGYLIVSYRSTSIQSTEPVRFQFQKIEEIPGYDAGKCVQENTCPDYGEPKTN